MLKLFIQIAITVLALSGANPAIAEQPLTLRGDVKVEKTVENEDGTKVTALVDPEVVVPGDRLVFGTDYTNSGAEAVENFVVTNPLPSAVRLADDADPALIVSVDGGENWGRVADLELTGPDGSSRSATAADVTHIRWTLAKIAPGEGGRLEYPAIIR